MQAIITMPKKISEIFIEPNLRYRGAYGGRGSGKTRNFALMSAIYGLKYAQENQPGVILCLREFMNSLDDSTMEEIKYVIRSIPWLNAYYEIGEKYIRTKNKKVEYKFAGLRYNLDSLKSKSNVLIAWVDEAESVSQIAWDKLLPTVRWDKSEIWVTWNPERKDSATDKMFRQAPLLDSKIVQVNYSDNEFFPEVLEKERLRCFNTQDRNIYNWIWEGDYLENSERLIFKNKIIVDYFDENLSDGESLLYGADFGFAVDPSTLVRMFVKDENLYIEYEAYGHGIEITALPSFYDQVPGSRDNIIKADNSRPEIISYLNKNGFNVKSVNKWGGSIQEGIMFLKSFKNIIIHPRCKHAIMEGDNYSYKIDKITNEITNVIEDRHNHIWDAVRYALDSYIHKKPITIWDIVGK